MSYNQIDSKIRNYYTQGNENKALELLINTYQKKLYWMIRRIVLTHDNANDVLQNTYIKVWKGMANFNENSKLYTWLFRIATNESLTFLDKNKHHYSNLSIEIMVANQLNFTSQNNEFNGDEIQKKLEIAIATLPEKQRAVFHLKYYEDLKYDEIAQILDTTEGGLKANYHHAVKKIENYLLNN